MDREDSPTVSAASGFDPSRNRMSPGFAVFNGHINNADKRARALMAKRCPKYLEKVEALERDGGGIMAIFDVAGPTWGPKAVHRYIDLVTAIVSENRDSDRSGEAGETGTGSTVGESAVPKADAQTSEVNND